MPSAPSSGPILGRPAAAALRPVMTWETRSPPPSAAIAGAPMNGVFNLGFLALMLWPVLASRKTQPA